MSIIEVDHVTKEFRLGQLTSFKQSMQRIKARLSGRRLPKRATFKALDDVNIKVEIGDIVGIIGPNGAGKSTLLKLLARVTAPTGGSIKVYGSVAPLIEVGAGLHPELTGRENIYLNGSILGIPRSEIKNKLDEIISFAELEEFIDTPIKRYSSGMRIRLGFSIATAVDPDILLVDEVLSVGDLAYQRKCFDRMEDLIRHRSKTVVIVSHNIRQVERMCKRVILLDRGRIIADGDPGEVCNLFFKHSNKTVLSYFAQQQGDRTRIRTSGEVEILSIDILNANDQPIREIKTGEMLRVRLRFELKRAIKKLEILIGTHTTDFVYLSAASSAVFEDRPDYPAGIHKVECIMPYFPLVAGIYCIRVAFFDQNRRKMFSGETLKMFSIVPSNSETREAPLRTLNLPSVWKMNKKVYCGDFSALSQELVDIPSEHK